MIKEIRRRMEQYHMLEPGDKVLIGLSGGADSICLAQSLYELSSEYGLCLGAVCCHHGLRGQEADEDVRFVEDFCKERNILFYGVKEDVFQRAKTSGMSLEEAGREFRYKSFRKIMEQHGYTKLAIAHNANDRAETMLFHMTRGTGLAGLCTMEPVRIFYDEKKLIRPLLWMKKSEIEAWLTRKQISWRVDSSNLEDLYSRNRIRHHVLPVLEQMNERAVEHMGETAEQMGELNSYIKEEEEKLYTQTVSYKNNKMMIGIPRLKEHHSYLVKAVLYRCLGEMAGGKKDVASIHVKILLDLMEGGSGKEAFLIRGIRARREYDFLILLKEELSEKEEKDGKKEEILKNLPITMEKFSYTGQEISKNEYTKHFDCAKIQNELCVRFWQQGDYLYLRENGGKKKLARYFIDAKIPLEEREQIPLLADGNHILWIVGHRISAYYKVTDKTEEILEVTIKNKG